MEFENKISRKLIGWSLLSVCMGMCFLLLRGQFLRGLGTQFLAWGVINSAIGSIAWHISSKNPKDFPNPIPEIDYPSRKRGLINFLRLNALLDIFYTLGGVRLMQTKGKVNVYWLGQGFGIMLQGLFLFFFDFYHSTRFSK